MNRRAFIEMSAARRHGRWRRARSSRRNCRGSDTWARRRSRRGRAVDHRLCAKARELGWVEGRDVIIEYRWAEGRTELFPKSPPTSFASKSM